MNEYFSRFAYLAPMETMDENETLLRLYISSIIGLLIMGLYKFFNTKTPGLSWLTTNFIFGCFFTISICVSARLSQIASEMKSADFHWFILPFYVNFMVAWAFLKFDATLRITSCICNIDFCDRGVFSILRNTNLMTYCIVPSYSIIFYYFKDEIEIINYIDPFTIMKIIRIACLLVTTIAQISSTTTYFKQLACYAIVNFLTNLVEGLSVWFLLESTRKYTITFTCTATTNFIVSAVA